MDAVWSFCFCCAAPWQLWVAHNLDSARTEFLEAMEDYQACMKAASGEIINICEPKRLVAKAAERSYKDAMSSGLSGSPRE